MVLCAKAPEGDTMPDASKTRGLFADWDGTAWRETWLTLLTQQCFDSNVFDPEKKEEFQKTRLDRRDRRVPYEDFEKRVVSMFLGQLVGKKVEDVEAAAAKVVEDHRDHVYTFTSTLVRLVAKTHQRIAVTGAIEEIASLLAPLHGFDVWYATQLERIGDVFTGVQLACPPHGKRSIVREHIRDHRIPHEGSIAIGDTGSDVEMLEQVMHPIAFNPNDTLAREAEMNGWPIVVERKDSIYVSAGSERMFRFTTARAEDAVHHALSCFRTYRP